MAATVSPGMMSVGPTALLAPLLLVMAPDFGLVRRSDDLGVQHVVLPPDIAPG